MTDVHMNFVTIFTIRNTMRLEEKLRLDGRAGFWLRCSKHPTVDLEHVTQTKPEAAC
jgi:hypothetical protein